MTVLNLSFSQIDYDTDALQLVRDNSVVETKDLWTVLLQGNEESEFSCTTGNRFFHAGGRTGVWSYAVGILDTPLTQSFDWSMRIAFVQWEYTATASAWVGAFNTASNLKNNLVALYLPGSSMQAFFVNSANTIRGGSSFAVVSGLQATPIYLTVDYDKDIGSGRLTFTCRTGSHAGTVLGTKTVDLSAGDTFSMDAVGITNNNYSGAANNYYSGYSILGAPEVDTGGGWGYVTTYAAQSDVLVRLDAGASGATHDFSAFAPYVGGTATFQYFSSNTAYDVTDSSDKATVLANMNGAFLTKTEMQSEADCQGRYLYLLIRMACADGVTCARVGVGPVSEFTVATGTVPDAPDITSATAGDGQVSLGVALNGNGDPVYILYRVSGGEWSEPDEALSVTETGSIVLSSLTNGTKYFFVAVSKSGIVYSLPSNEATATPIGGSATLPVEAAIKALLEDDDSISKLVSTKIFPNLAPQGTAEPFIVFTRVSSNHLNHIVNAAGLVTVSIQLDIYSDSYMEAKDIADAVRLVLSGYRGAVTKGDRTLTISSCILRGEQDGFENPSEGSERGTYRVIHDYEVTHGEAVRS